MRISDWSSDVCSSDLLPKGEDSRLKLVADVVPVEGEAERPGGFLHSFQMVRQMNNAFIWVEPHRLDQVEGDVAGPGERALGQAFAPFGIRRSVGDQIGRASRWERWGQYE